MSFQKSTYGYQPPEKDVLAPVTCQELSKFIQKNKPHEVAIPTHVDGEIGNWFWITSVTYRAGFIILKSTPVTDAPQHGDYTRDIIAPQELVSILKRYPDGTPAILIEDKVYLFKNYKLVKTDKGPKPLVTFYLGYPRNSLELSCSLDWLGDV